MKLKIQTNRYFSSIQEFVFIRDIGVGSFGIVRMALHIETNRSYAVKIDLSKCSCENQQLMLERQINIHTRIDHPHIIKLWDTLVEGNVVYMVLELAEKGTLFSYQNKNPQLSEDEAYKYFSQSVSAIKYMHKNDLMHRDIKPQNILLDNDQNIKICDLGWATDQIRTKKKTFCGTYEYMAPEMIFERDYDYSIDIWALGILLYQLLHGHAPYIAKSADQMKERFKRQFYGFDQNLSEQVKKIIAEILQKQPQKRPSFSTLLAHPWVQNMRSSIINKISTLDCELWAQNSNRAKVQKQKSSFFTSIKKHKRFDSLANSLNTNKKDVLIGSKSGVIIQRLKTETKQNKLKKKCKTLAEESIQKLYDESFKAKGIEHKLKRGKQNYIKTQNIPELQKDSFSLKNNTIFSHLKVNKSTDKLKQISMKYSLQKKKKKIKGHKQTVL